MENKIYILDASGIINGFYSDKTQNIMTSKAVEEIKDLQTQIKLDECIENGIIKIEDITPDDYEKIMPTLLESGDFLRLSDTDKQIVALALKYKNNGYNPVTVTDDYSMQNTLKLLNLKFKPVNTKGIKNTIQWVRICKGCKKEYETNYPYDECEICGSEIIRKRVGGRNNY
ncbi:PIN domain-containing protein [Methanosphaera cuniculi]|uniref:Ribonuclease VapC n=1 Tax=Methanosphaera cuniculi TaxID=1077256 RepID=A0A2A2HDW4_9EURY|nr:ribonuclease VapC [Methanosphaera cuniculi]PAV07413.1 ribonuclease VapC [Methanosphaera cuniculi]PWL08226.1 tRNA(fMet)-specific endonuclease VapC [Methanosphaera cuniculi]